MAKQKKAKPLKDTTPDEAAAFDNDRDLAMQILGQYRDIKLREQKERDLWNKCYEYVNSRVDGEIGQWKAEIRKELTAQGRPVTSFNIVKKFINRICGAQSVLRLDEKVYPTTDDADSTIADIQADLVKFVKENNRADLKIRKSFRDGVITSTGWLKAEWSNEFDPLGDIVIKSISPKRVFIIGEGEEYDVSLDRRGLIELIPMDKDAMKAKWPDKADEIDSLVADADKDEIPVAHTYDYGFGLSVPTDLVYDKNDKKIYVLRRQYFEYKSVEFWQDGKTSELNQAPTEPKAREAAEEAAKAQGIAIKSIKKSVKKVRITYSCGPMLLEDGPSPYKHNRFDLVNFFCYTDDGVETGIAQDLLDPQDEKNKRRSNFIHMQGTAAKNSHWVKKGALDDINKSRTEIARTGALIEVNGDPRQVTAPIESNMQAMQALVQLEEMAQADTREISGITDASLGITPTGVKSGRAVMALQQPVEAIIAEIHDNYLYTREILFETVLSLIQQYYTEERRIRITGDYLAKKQPAEIVQLKEQAKAKMMAAGVSETAATMQAEKLIEVMDGSKQFYINRTVANIKLNDISQGKYKLKVDEVSQNPTARQQQYNDMLNMKSLGAPIGWDKVVRASDIRGKQEILADMEQEAAMMAQQAMAGTKPPQTATPPSPPQPGDELENQAGAQF